MRDALRGREPQTERGPSRRAGERARGRHTPMEPRAGGLQPAANRPPAAPRCTERRRLRAHWERLAGVGKHATSTEGHTWQDRSLQLQWTPDELCVVRARSLSLISLTGRAHRPPRSLGGRPRFNQPRPGSKRGMRARATAARARTLKWAGHSERLSPLDGSVGKCVGVVLVVGLDTNVKCVGSTDLNGWVHRRTPSRQTGMVLMSVRIHIRVQPLSGWCSLSLSLSLFLGLAVTAYSRWW